MPSDPPRGPRKRTQSEVPLLKPRPRKEDHAIYADVTDSKSKAGVWFGGQVEFKAQQGQIMQKVQEETDWVPIEGAIMIVSTEPAGIVVIAPNPTLPGIIVLADAGTRAKTDELRTKYTTLIRSAMEQLSIPPTDS